jgi:hypothetical protein
MSEQTWRRRLRRWWQGECAIDGCDAKPAHRLTGLCVSHYQLRLTEIAREYAAREFERDVRVTAEALRRTLPAALAASKEGRRDDEG